MPKPDIYLSVIVPAYNEAEKLPKTLKRFQEYLFQQAYSYEIIVVNDGARDNTADVVRNMERDIKNLRFIDRKKNMGKGYTVREGMLQASGKIRLFMDADNGTDISHFEKMRPFFDKGYDLVISSRDPRDTPGGEEEKQPLWRRAFGNIGNIIIRFMAVPGIWDTQNGFKAFRDHAAEKIFRLAKIDRWLFDVEILALAKRLNYKIGIIPAHWINDPRSFVKLSSYLRSLWEVLKIRWNLSMGRYKL